MNMYLRLKINNLIGKGPSKIYYQINLTQENGLDQNKINDLPKKYNDFFRKEYEPN